MFSSIFDKCIMLQDKQNIHEKGEWLRKGLKMFGMHYENQRQGAFITRASSNI